MLTWSGATFDHSAFVLNGAHQAAACIDCHEHNKNEMDDEHDDVGGYSYNSQACYSCHPDGRADD